MSSSPRGLEADETFEPSPVGLGGMEGSELSGGFDVEGRGRESKKVPGRRLRQQARDAGGQRAGV